MLSARIESTGVYSNTASLSAGFENRSGDSAVPVVVLNSHLHDNAAGVYGGAIGNYGTLIISATTLNGNSAASRGGGIYNYSGGTLAVTNIGGSGGGITNISINTVNAWNTILANNTASNATGSDASDIGGFAFGRVAVNLLTKADTVRKIARYKRAGS